MQWAAVKIWLGEMRAAPQYWPEPELVGLNKAASQGHAFFLDGRPPTILVWKFFKPHPEKNWEINKRRDEKNVSNANWNCRFSEKKNLRFANFNESFLIKRQAKLLLHMMKLKKLPYLLTTKWGINRSGGGGRSCCSSCGGCSSCSSETCEGSSTCKKR